MDKSRIPSLQEKYGLTYHVPYAVQADELVGLAGKRVLEVGGSLPKDFVLNEIGASQWIGLHAMSYWGEITEDGGGTRPPTSIERRLADSNPADLGAYEVLSGEIESLPESLNSAFDVVFSIAAFEHLLSLPLALRKMHAALRPGGAVFTMFAPVWSSHNGHHLPNIVDKAGRQMTFEDSPIPPWGHLLFRPPELLRYLSDHTDTDTASKIVYYVFHSPHINRLFTDDFAMYAQSSPFHLELFGTLFRSEIPERTHAELRRLNPRNAHFDNNGVVMVLRKRA